MELVVIFLILSACDSLLAGKLYSDYNINDKTNPHDTIFPKRIKILKDYYAAKPTQYKSKVYEYDFHDKDKLDIREDGTDLEAKENKTKYPGFLSNYIWPSLGEIILNKKKVLSKLFPHVTKTKTVTIENPELLEKETKEFEKTKVHKPDFENEEKKWIIYTIPHVTLDKNQLEINKYDDINPYQNWIYSSPEIEQEIALENYFDTIKKYQDTNFVSSEKDILVSNKNNMVYNILDELFIGPNLEEKPKYYYPGHEKNPKKVYKDPIKSTGIILKNKIFDKSNKIYDTINDKIDLLKNKKNEKPTFIGIFAEPNKKPDVFGRKYINQNKTNILDEGKHLDPREVYEGDKVIEENDKKFQTDNPKTQKQVTEGLKDIPLNGICPLGYNKDILGVCRLSPPK